MTVGSSPRSFGVLVRVVLPVFVLKGSTFISGTGTRVDAVATATSVTSGFEVVEKKSSQERPPLS